MPKYLLQASYTESGLQGLLKEGGTKRVEAVTKAIQGLDGKVEAFYFAFGDSDVFLIIDLPDNVSASAMALTVAATGTVKTKTTVLLTPEEVDRAMKKTVNYRAPGR
jgi:uncharacterized protein with GYD domain